MKERKLSIPIWSLLVMRETIAGPDKVVLEKDTVIEALPAKGREASVFSWGNFTGSQRGWFSRENIIPIPLSAAREPNPEDAINRRYTRERFEAEKVEEFLAQEWDDGEFSNDWAQQAIKDFEGE